MNLINELMPTYRLRQIDRVPVAASPTEAWNGLQSFDGSAIPYVRWLFDLRLLPAQLSARLRSAPAPERAHLALREAGEAPGFFRLESPGHELCVGSIGKFWQSHIDFAPGACERFADFSAPGFGKLAWSLRVDPRRGGGSWITFELRVTATDDAAWRKFGRYWLLIGKFSHVIRRGLLRALTRRLGGAPPLATQALPGDDILPAPGLVRTHWTVIEAPPARVFPWLARMGEGRSGWCALDVDEPRAVVLGAPSLLPGQADSLIPDDEPPLRDTWAFVAEPIGDDATLLLTRVRAEYPDGAAGAWRSEVMGAAHGVLERAKLRLIKRQAEGPAAAS